MALLHFFKRPSLSNGLQSDLETKAVHSLLVVDYAWLCIVASCLEPSVDTRERVWKIVAMLDRTRIVERLALSLHLVLWAAVLENKHSKMIIGCLLLQQKRKSLHKLAVRSSFPYKNVSNKTGAIIYWRVPCWVHTLSANLYSPMVTRAFTISFHCMSIFLILAAWRVAAMGCWLFFMVSSWSLPNPKWTPSRSHWSHSNWLSCSSVGYEDRGST